MKPQVAVIMGSDSDLPVMKGAIEALSHFKVPTEVQVVSAHRSPKYMQSYALKAQTRGLKIIIAGAGGAAHLPGMVASLTPLPVIGVPVTVGKLEGLDSLLSILQMPKGVPVATVAVDNSFNAGLLAVRMLALSSQRLQRQLKDFETTQRQKVRRANQKLKVQS